MKRRNSEAGLRKPRLVAGIGRFIIDALAFGTRILIGEAPFNRR